MDALNTGIDDHEGRLAHYEMLILCPHMQIMTIFIWWTVDIKEASKELLRLELMTNSHHYKTEFRYLYGLAPLLEIICSPFGLAHFELGSVRIGLELGWDRIIFSISLIQILTDHISTGIFILLEF
jgi:hypothetical protein